VNGDEETPLFRDRDGSILLMRLPGDAWTVCKCQSDADWIRATECSGALTGLTKDGVSFLPVVPLSEVKEALLEAAADRQDVGLSRTVGELLDAAFPAHTEEKGEGRAG